LVEVHPHNPGAPVRVLASKLLYRPGYSSPQRLFFAS